MKKKKLNLVLTMLLGIGLFSPVLTAKENASPKAGAQQNIAIKLGKYTNDLHSVTMALKFGEMLANKGADVTLFLNLEAVRLVDKRQPNDLIWGKSHPISELYLKAIASGVSILVCPHCAKVVGLEKKNLRKPAKMGDSESLSDMILKADKVIDY